MVSLRLWAKMTIKDAIVKASTLLKGVCERPQYEAELLLAYQIKQDRTYLVTHDNDDIDIKEYDILIKRRKNHEPYEYIVGVANFYDISLKVGEGVLIPRPETEILIDLVSDIIGNKNITFIAEIGVGSGAISVVLARKFPEIQIKATDICDKAIEISQLNIHKYQLADRITVVKSNLLDEVSESVELVVSNPPYIAKDFLLASNVIDFEPKEALFGGRVGDELLKEIIIDVKKRDVKWLACEMGYDQKEAIQAFVNDVGVKSIEFYKDLAGLDRGFIIEYR